MDRIRVRLLGRFEVTLADGQLIQFESRKTEALLALLACRPDDGLSREIICGTLWGDRGERQARHSLSQALSELRRALPCNRCLLDATRDAVALAADAVDVDVTAFNRLVAEGGRLALRQAASLYRGSLLEGFALREGDFEEWLARERMRLAERAGATLLRLAEDEIAAKDHAAALAALTRALELDPLSEEAHRRLIRLHMDQGRYNQAIQQYRACETIIRQELGAAPEPSTVALYAESLRRSAATPTSLPPTGETKTAAVPIGQRKSVSVLRATLFVGRGPGASGDLGEMEDELAPFLDRIAQATERYGGSIVARAADAMTAVFGIPAAFEDHAARACQAAAEMSALASEALAGEARLSVAVDSGDVAFRGGESTSPQREELRGDCLRRAEWLSGCGRIDGIGVTGITARLADRYWRFRPLTEIRFETDGPPLSLFSPVSRHAGHGGFSQFLGRRLSPFIGRHPEMDVLLSASSLVAAGQGQLVAAVGHPGVGKSRLFHEFLQSIPSSWQVLTCRGDPQFTDTADWPIAGLIRDCCRISDDVPRAQLGEAIDHSVAALGAGGDSMVAALTSLLGVEPNDPVWSSLEPRLRRRRIADSVRSVLRRKSVERPLVIAMEDLHWFDAASREIVDRLVEVLATARILLILNYRPEFSHAWAGRSFYQQIQLSSLSERQAAELTDALLGPNASTSSLRDGLLARTDGNPFFIEECVRALAEAGDLSGEPGFYRIARPSDRIVLPDTVQAVIAARIDGLSAGGKELLQVAAIVGNEGLLPLLGAVAALDEDRLREAMAELQCAEFLVETLLGGEPAFRFKHALVQDAAYGTLLRAGRRELHGRIARILEDQYVEAGRVEARPSDGDDGVATTVAPALLAHHWQQAGDPGQALAYWTVAGDVAERRAATREAAAHYRAALSLVQSATLPTDHRAREPELWMKLGNALMQVEGYASADAADAYRRARTAARALDQPESFAKAGIGMAPLLFGGCRYREVVDILGEISGEMLDRLTPQTRIQLLATLSVANYNLGEFATAWNDLGKACALDRETPYTHEGLLGGADPAIAARAYAVQAGEALGKIDRCLQFGEEAVAIARKRNHPFTLAWAHQVAARAFLIAGQYDNSIANGDAAVAICEQRGFHLRLGTVLMLRGTALCRRGDTDRGLAEIRRGLALWRQASGIFETTQNLSGLAECLLQAGLAGEADAALREAEQVAAETDERSHYGELKRLRGILWSLGGEAHRAIACLKQAIEWSRAHQATMHELRAARDLARVFADQAPRSVKTLRSVIARFPPLLDAPDLAAARTVLRDCARQPHATGTLAESSPCPAFQGAAHGRAGRRRSRTSIP